MGSADHAPRPGFIHGGANSVSPSGHMVHLEKLFIFQGEKIFFKISEMLLETNSSPTCTPLFLLPFAESQAVLVYRWHLREALRSVCSVSLAHITGQTCLHSN